MQALADWHVFVDPDALVVLGLLGSCDFLSCRADAVPQGRTVIAEREVPDVRGIERKRLGTRAIGGGAPHRSCRPAWRGSRSSVRPATRWRERAREAPPYHAEGRAEEYTYELQSLISISYAVFFMTTKTTT